MTSRSGGHGAGQPSWVDPQLATLSHDRFSSPGWIYERKFDGERCLAYRGDGQVRLFSRNANRLDGTFPEIAAALAAVAAADFIVDGEIVAFDGAQTSFARLQRRLGVARPPEALRREVPVWYYLFDLVYADGEDLRPLPLRERKARLRRLLPYSGRLRFAVHRDRDGEEYWAQACRRGWEGVIAKRAAAPYRGGRGRDWLKFKCEQGQELVIGGYTAPQGSRIELGALLVGYYEDGRLRYAGKVGTGFDRDTLRELGELLRARHSDESPFDAAERIRERHVSWVRPELVAQIGFAEWTGYGRLRHPRYLGLREDKAAREVVRER